MSGEFHLKPLAPVQISRLAVLVGLVLLGLGTWAAFALGGRVFSRPVVSNTRLHVGRLAVTPAPALDDSVAVAPPRTTRTGAHFEQQGSRGSNSFSDPMNVSGEGPRVPPFAWVRVTCRIYAPQAGSVNPDGFWYRLASSPWNDVYFAPANTFWNGDQPGHLPYIHNTDFAIRMC
jgi:hypothetical protein